MGVTYFGPWPKKAVFISHSAKVSLLRSSKPDPGHLHIKIAENSPPTAEKQAGLQIQENKLKKPRRKKDNFSPKGLIVQNYIAIQN